jgi:hypothetical protein
MPLKDAAHQIYDCLRVAGVTALLCDPASIGAQCRLDRLVVVGLAVAAGLVFWWSGARLGSGRRGLETAGVTGITALATAAVIGLVS